MIDANFTEADFPANITIDDHPQLDEHIGQVCEIAQTVHRYAERADQNIDYLRALAELLLVNVYAAQRVAADAGVESALD